MCLSAQHVRRASQRELQLRTNGSESKLKWEKDRVRRRERETVGGCVEIKTGELAVSLTFSFHGRKS